MPLMCVRFFISLSRLDRRITMIVIGIAHYLVSRSINSSEHHYIISILMSTRMDRIEGVITKANICNLLFVTTKLFRTPCHHIRHYELIVHQ